MTVYRYPWLHGLRRRFHHLVLVVYRCLRWSVMMAALVGAFVILGHFILKYW